MNPKLYGFLTCILQTLLLSSATLEPFDLLYENGLEAFHKGDYGNVVRYMESALSSFSEVRQTKIRCRLKCRDQHRFDSLLTDKFFEAILYRAHCLNECFEGKLGAQSMHKVSEDVSQDFSRRIPYNYLQLAYRKVGTSFIDATDHGLFNSEVRRLHQERLNETLVSIIRTLEGNIVVHLTCV